MVASERDSLLAGSGNNSSTKNNNNNNKSSHHNANSTTPSILDRRRNSVTVNRLLLLSSISLLVSCLIIAIVVPVVRHHPGEDSRFISQRRRRHYYHRHPAAANSNNVAEDDGAMRFDDDDDDEDNHGGNNERKYTATQFISFTINTLGGSAEHGECENRSIDTNTGLCYLGNSHNNITEDVYHRLQIVELALTRLKNDAFKEENEVDRSSQVLKIFMLPEFFLRGPNGAYSVEDAYDDPNDDRNDGVLIQVSDRLRELVEDPAFENYLFVFGTVIIAQSLNDSSSSSNTTTSTSTKPWEMNDISASDVMYYNLATVMKGGMGVHHHKYLFQKRYISGADFLSRTTLPNPSNEDLHRYANPWTGMISAAEQRGTKIVEDGNLIEVNGIRIGMEICLDHRMGVLWDALKTKYNSKLVDVQLIISAGMAIERGPNPIVSGGVVYLTDGEASSAACMRTDTGPYDPDKVCREKPDGIKRIPHGGPGYSNFFPLAACLDMEKSDLLKGYYSLYQTQGCAYTLKLYGIDVMDEFKYYPPSIEIYPTVDLPPASVGSS